MVTESVDSMATLRDIIRKEPLSRFTRSEVLWLFDHVEKLTLRDLCIEYIKEAQRLYAEAERVKQERTPVALHYAEICNVRADAYTQAAAMIHYTVESRWGAAIVTPRDGDSG
jgi:hypothetical protein